MLLAVDIGNTNTKIAIADGHNVLHEWRISTDAKRTGDEYFSILRPLIRDAEIDVKKIDSAILSSVVPALIGAFVIVSQHLIGKKPIIIGPDMYDCLPIKLPESAKYEIGTDLLCNAVEAWSKYKSAAIIVDFGTALSFTAVDQNANVSGVAIAPGIGTALKALFMNTAQLPSVPLEIPQSSLGKNTTSAIQSGILFGYKGLLESLINKMKDDMHKETGINQSEIKVIATGGLNSMLQPITSVFDCVDKKLTINGIITVAEFVKNNSK